MLIESDGMVEPLISCWMESGFDILFPIKVGTWKSDPNDIRKRYGRNLRMFGRVDKHVIPQGEAAVRAHLEHLKPVVRDGGCIPIPDHRIPPSCSLEQFQAYVRIFKEVYADLGKQRIQVSERQVALSSALANCDWPNPGTHRRMMLRRMLRVLSPGRQVMAVAQNAVIASGPEIRKLFAAAMECQLSQDVACCICKSRKSRMSYVTPCRRRC